MKLTVFLLIVCLHVSAQGYAQKITLAEKNAPLEKVFGNVKVQMGHNYCYLYQLLGITLEVKNASLDKVMGSCFKDQPLKYSILGKIILIKEKISEMRRNGDRLTKSGLIEGERSLINEKGEPVEGAKLEVKEMKKGTVANIMRAFYLNDVDEGNLDETVVKVYGTTAKVFNTGNIRIVKADEIEKQPIISTMPVLQGIVPGLNIKHPNDIESIEVLNDKKTITYCALFINKGNNCSTVICTSAAASGYIYQNRKGKLTLTS